VRGVAGERRENNTTPVLRSLRRCLVSGEERRSKPVTRASRQAAILKRTSRGHASMVNGIYGRLVATLPESGCWIPR
jgi:hypothetical protein